jgi:hypothetical protein
VPREKKQISASGYGVLPDWTQERNLYYWADEILKSAKEFGWKGIRFDGTPEFIAMNSIEYYNSEGRRFTLAEKQALSKESNAKFRKYIKSKAPDFLLYYNCEPALDKVTPYSCLPEFAADGSTVGSEVTRDMVSSSNPYNSWDELYERFALNVELVRQYETHKNKNASDGDQACPGRRRPGRALPDLRSGCSQALAQRGDVDHGLMRGCFRAGSFLVASHVARPAPA